MRRYATLYIIGIDEAGRAVPKRGEPRPAFIIGIDEAGRGPLAGPVVVAGIKSGSFRPKFLRDIKDSKKLSAKRREEWFRILTDHPEIEWAVAMVSPKVIDRINIARAANLGARRVCDKLSFGGKKLGLAQVVLDGGLYLPLQIRHKTIIKGDEKVPVIAAASIIAKVTRDRIMRRLHKKYPQYGFDAHKGYATELHRGRVRLHGRSAVHRKTFQY